jgi:hypothetical protein
VGVGWRCLREGFHKRTRARPTREDHPAVTTTRQPAYDAAVVVVGALETVAEAA